MFLRYAMFKDNQQVSTRAFIFSILLISLFSGLAGFLIRGAFLKQTSEPKPGAAELLFGQGIDPFGLEGDIEVMFPTPDYMTGKIEFGADMYKNQHAWEGELAFLSGNPVSGFVFSKDGAIVGIGAFDKPLGPVIYSQGMSGAYVSLKRYRPVFLEYATQRTIRFEPR